MRSTLLTIFSVLQVFFLLACSQIEGSSNEIQVVESLQCEQSSTESSNSSSPIIDMERFNQLLGCHIERFESADIIDETYSVNAEQTEGEYSFIAIDGFETVQANVTLSVSKEADSFEEYQKFNSKEKNGFAYWELDGLYYKLSVVCDDETIFLKWLSYIQYAVNYN